MKNPPKKLLIVIVVSTVLLCSVVVILSQSGIVLLEQKLIPPGEYVPPERPEMLPKLTSHEEAIALTDEFMKETLGEEFFDNYLKVKGVDELPYSPSTWIVLYEYVYDGYTVEFLIVIDIRCVPKGTSRIDADVSNVILEPQEILISEEEAKRIAQEYGLEPPYNVILSCEVGFHRICWRITRKDLEGLTEYDLAGVIIDAESGEILEASTRVYGGWSCAI